MFGATGRKIILGSATSVRSIKYTYHTNPPLIYRTATLNTNVNGVNKEPQNVIAPVRPHLEVVSL